jgi:hypothetical protein
LLGGRDVALGFVGGLADFFGTGVAAQVQFGREPEDGGAAVTNLFTATNVLPCLGAIAT